MTELRRCIESLDRARLQANDPEFSAVADDAKRLLFRLQVKSQHPGSDPQTTKESER